jgi:hypothetical protein
MIRSSILSRVVGAVAAVTVVSTGLPAFAADGQAPSWFAAQKEILRSKLQSAPPMAFKIIGETIVPVVVKTAPKYIVTVEALGPVVGGASARAMR